MKRRQFLLGAGAAAAAATAGCTDALGSDRLRFEAEEARVRSSVVDETGYEARGTDDLAFERTVEVGGESRTVEVISRYAAYEKAVDVGGESVPAAAFSVVSTPAVEVLGQSVNPIDDLSPETVARRVADRYERVEDLSVAGEAPVTVLGTETTRTRFEGEVELDGGQTVDVAVHVSDPVAQGDDLVLGVGGHPRRMADEADAVEALLEGIEHGES